MENRYIFPFIKEDLAQKMVFLAGPRQVGKTTLSRRFIGRSEDCYYLWDNREDRKKILAAQWPAAEALIILDELHKYRHWKNWLKGEFDKHRHHLQFMVTGSARLDVYRRGGDSLQGRYHHWRLHPFSLNELEGRAPPSEPLQELSFSSPSPDALASLDRFSGFPEPLFAQSVDAHRRWQKERLERFFREDVRDLENVRDLSSMQLLADLLPGRVASPLSLNSLREDLEVSHRAVTHWIDILERLYFIYRLYPFTASKIRGLKKEAKAYVWDWTLVEDEGDRFENMIASHLLKFCHFLEDSKGYAIQLHHLRDAAKHEVDFLVTVKGKPWFAVEAKHDDAVPSSNLHYFGSRLKIPFLYQVVKTAGHDFVQQNVRVISADKFLTGLV